MLEGLVSHSIGMSFSIKVQTLSKIINYGLITKQLMNSKRCIYFCVVVINFLSTDVPTKNDSYVIFFTNVKLNINLYTPFKVTRIDRSIVY